MKRVTAIIGLAVLLSSAALSQNVSVTEPEQQSFEIGQRGPVVKHPVPISDADLAALSKVKLSENVGLMPRTPTPAPSFLKPTREGLEAALVHLNGPDERDLVVIGSGRQYARADIAPFWVIRERPDGPIVVLAVWTHQLRILKTKHRDMADIDAWRDTGMGTSVTHFEFNGFKYFEFMEIVN